MSNMEPLIPELGDLLTIVSDVYKSTTGRIIYRDASLIRVRPFNVSDRAIEFPLDESGMFQDSLGVRELILHEKAKYPQYAKQLGVLPGETLEFYAIDGTPSADSGVIQVILADDAQDAIQLTDGRILAFDFLGPQPPFAVIVPRSAPEEFPTIENNTDIVVPEEFPEFDFELPLALVEEIPTSERSYSDSVQREDMFVSLLLDEPLARQKNPRLLRSLYRTTDLLLAIKNSVVVRDATGGVLADSRRSYIPSSLTDVLALQYTPAPIAALLPVADVKKVLYTDDEGGDYDDVQVRPDVGSLLEASATTATFQTGSEMGNPFLSYMDFLLRRNLPSFVPRSQHPTEWIQVDQDVLRSKMPPHAVQGFPAGLPPGIAARRDEDTTQLTVEFLATVEDRSARLLSASQVLDRKTGQTYQIAPADPATTVDHILLSEEVSAYRAPTRSSVLLWDIQASQLSRDRSKTLYSLLKGTWDKQQPLSQTKKGFVDLLEERIPPVLCLAERPILHTLDTLGLRSLELDMPMMDVLSKAILAGRTAWDTAFHQLRARAQAAQEVDALPLLPPITDALWSIEQPDFVRALSTVQEREPTLYPTLARTAAVLTEANGTLLDLWYAAAGNHAIQTAAETYRAETLRLARRDSNTRKREAELSATLLKNDCPHVYMLESIRSIRDDAKKWAMFQDFLTKYQAGVRGNWVICGSCTQNLVCRHELMLLHEFQHPGRSVALHKSLLLEMSGPVFEGAYICKNCGQKIAEIEYDSHLEFDDDGKPLVGRTVVPKMKTIVVDGEEVEVEEDELDLATAMQDEGQIKDNEGFTGEDAKSYFLIRTVMGYCGVTPTKEQYQRMVGAVRDFKQFKLPPKVVYEAQKKKAEAEKKPFYKFTYETYAANLVLGLVGALAVLEIQTTNPPIPFPARGCTLARGGIPLEKEGMGALTYVACVIAGVLRNSAPWNLVSWTREESLPKRQAAAQSDIRAGLNTVLATPGPSGIAPPPLTTVTDFYKTALEEARKREEEKGIAEDPAVLLLADRIPPSFRPLPLVREEETTAIRNVSKLATEIAEGDIQEVKEFVAQRQGDILRSTLGTFHASALQSAKSLHILSETNPRSDATCCFKRLGVVALQGNGYASLIEELGENKAKEVIVLEEGASQLRRRDPILSSNGSRFYVPWSAPTTTSFQPAADASMYYRLFLKNCFHGDSMGFPHEFGIDFQCRRCGYQLPPELDYLTASNIGISDSKKFAKTWEEMQETRKQQSMQSVEGLVNEQTFHALEDAIHTRKTAYPPVYSQPKQLLELMEGFRQLLQRIPVLPSALQEWAVLQQILVKQVAEEWDESPKRRLGFAVFERTKNALAERVEKRMKDLLGPRPAEVNLQAIRNAMESLQTLTAVSEGSINARNLLTMLVVPSEQMVVQYKNEKLFLHRWFPSIAPSHKKLLQTIWTKHNAMFQKANDALETLGKAQEHARQAMQSVTAWLGEWLQIWIQELRPSFSYQSLTPEESSIILQWTVYTAMASLLFEESPLYVELQDKAPLHRFFQSWFVSLLQLAAAESQKYQLTAKQIQDELLSRQEREKAYFIKRFDDLDRDLRKVELIKKRLKIGDWSVGMKNLFQYDADFFEFERGQRAGMGLPEFDADITGVIGATAENPYGFMEFGVEMPAVGVNDHRTEQDEDAN